MSKIRPTLRDTNKPGLSYYDSYYRVLQATANCRGLIHGRLEDMEGGVCAVGSYFEQSRVPINTRAVEEIATFNDSFPNLSAHARWLRVRQWLKFKVEKLRGDNEAV